MGERERGGLGSNKGKVSRFLNQNAKHKQIGHLKFTENGKANIGNYNIHEFAVPKEKKMENYIIYLRIYQHHGENYRCLSYQKY